MIKSNHLLHSDSTADVCAKGEHQLAYDHSKNWRKSVSLPHPPPIPFTCKSPTVLSFTAPSLVSRWHLAGTSVIVHECKSMFVLVDVQLLFRSFTGLHLQDIQLKQKACSSQSETLSTEVSQSLIFLVLILWDSLWSNQWEFDEGAVSLGCSKFARGTSKWCISCGIDCSALNVHQKKKHNVRRKWGESSFLRRMPDFRGRKPNHEGS